MPCGFRSSSFVALPLLAWSLVACDDRTPEEKGKDYADEKLGFAQGAADTLKAKGAHLGQTAGQGVGDLVKGIGSGVKDSATPEVPARASASAREAGVSIEHASEGGSDGNARLLHAYVEFTRAFHGRLELTAHDADGREIGRGAAPAPLDFAGPKKELVTFRFADSVRFSHVKHYELVSAKLAEVRLGEGLSGLGLSQLKVSEHTVTLYVRFEKAFRGKLELRAFAADGAELGRSKKTAALTASVDSAEYVDFEFDPRAPIDQAARFELR